VETVRSGVIPRQPTVWAEAAQRREVTVTSNMRVDLVRPDRHPVVVVVGVGRVRGPVGEVQSAVWAVPHHRVAATGEPESQIVPLPAEVVSPLVAEEEGRVHLWHPLLRVEGRVARVR